MNAKINWKQKFSSRKLWLAIVGIVSGIAMIQNGNITEGTALIGSSVLGYLIAEGYIDAKAATATALMVSEISGAIKEAIAVKKMPSTDDSTGSNE